MFNIWELMHSEGIWVLVSFLLFVGLIFKPVRMAVLKFLDEKAAKISSRLDEVAKIRSESLRMLEEIKEQYAKAENDRMIILNKAKLEAESLIKDAQIEVNRLIKKRTDLAIQRIAQEEENIIREIKAEAVESAIQSVQSTLLSEVNTKTKLDMVDDSLKIIKKFLN